MSLASFVRASIFVSKTPVEKEPPKLAIFWPEDSGDLEEVAEYALNKDGKTAAAKPFWLKI